MNRWKHDLNEIAGDFKEEQARLMAGTLKKKQKMKKRKTIYTSTLSTILVAVLGLFLYQVFQPEQATTTSVASPQPNQQLLLKFASPEEPVYFDEKTFLFYKSVFLTSEMDLTDDNMTYLDPESIAFFSMISLQAIEYQAVIDGFKYDPAEYAKELEKVKSKITPEIIQEIKNIEKEIGISSDKFIEQILIPYTAKLELLESFVDDQESIRKKMYEFQEQYQEKILALAADLNIKFDGYYNGVVAAVEGKKILVIKDASKEEVKNLDVQTILNKYDDHFWFTVEQDAFVEVGSTINVTYKDAQMGDENIATSIAIEILAE